MPNFKLKYEDPEKVRLTKGVLNTKNRHLGNMWLTTKNLMSQQ